MGLLNVYNFNRQKTVKLTDTYQVFLTLSQSDFEKIFNGNNTDMAKFMFDGGGMTTGDAGYLQNSTTVKTIELFECTGVTLPSFKYKDETYKYGNFRHNVLLPDYESVGNLELTLLEHYDDPDTADTDAFDPKINNNLLNIQSYVDLFLSKLFDIETFTYKLHDYIPKIEVRITNNAMDKYVMSYIFENLKLISYDSYNLDYTSSSPVTWKLSFAFQGYYVESYNIVNEETTTKETEETEQTNEAEKSNTVEPVENATAENMYNAQQEARKNQASQGRGVQTPTEDLDHSVQHQQNVTNRNAGQSIDAEQLAVQDLTDKKAETDQQIETKKNELTQLQQEHEQQVKDIEKEKLGQERDTMPNIEPPPEIDFSGKNIFPVETTPVDLINPAQPSPTNSEPEQQSQEKTTEEKANETREKINQLTNEINALEEQSNEIGIQLEDATQKLNDKIEQNNAIYDEIDTANAQVERFTERVNTNNNRLASSSNIVHHMSDEDDEANENAEITTTPMVFKESTSEENPTTTTDNTSSQKTTNENTTAQPPIVLNNENNNEQPGNDTETPNIWSIDFFSETSPTQTDDSSSNNADKLSDGYNAETPNDTFAMSFSPDMSNLSDLNPSEAVLSTANSTKAAEHFKKNVYRDSNGVATVGYGTAATGGNIDLYLKSDDGEIKHVTKSSELKNYVGWSLTNQSGNATDAEAEQLAERQMIKSLQEKEQTAKRLCKKNNIDWDSYSAVEQGMLIDGYYLGGGMGNVAAKVIDYSHKNPNATDREIWEYANKQIKNTYSENQYATNGKGWTNRILNNLSKVRGKTQTIRKTSNNTFVMENVK